jgi:hypothetical protein
MNPTDNDAKFARYAALNARIAARLATPREGWDTHIDLAPIRITAKNALTTAPRKG